jgi:hypothetical protein
MTVWRILKLNHPAALERKDFDVARYITKRIAFTYEPFLAARNWPEFIKYNIPLKKLALTKPGLCNPGRRATPTKMRHKSIWTARLNQRVDGRSSARNSPDGSQSDAPCSQDQPRNVPNARP